MKIHVRRSTTEHQANIPACAFNARNYDRLPSQFVKGPKEFRAVPSSDRCQHCENKYMEVRNMQRKAKGLQPVSSPFEGLI